MGMVIDNAIIMAGGIGSRLWPVSTVANPKQFFDPGIGTSLLRATIERALTIGIKGRIVIVTHADYVRRTCQLCNDLAAGVRRRIVIAAEPLGRNTAPALAYALTLLPPDETRQSPWRPII